MKSLLASVIAFTLCTPIQAMCAPILYVGTIKVKNVSVPAKATYEELDYLQEPKIEIKYKISGEDYLSVYMSGFGDKYTIKPSSITVYNDSPDKKQNYYFSGKQASWLEYYTY